MNTISNHPYVSQLVSVLGSNAISFRLIAEAPTLKAKLASKNGDGKRLQLIKSLPTKPLESRVADLVTLNLEGYAVFFEPTEFREGYTETYEDIVKFRAFVVDLDQAHYQPTLECGYPPTMIVETSAGRYQCIWSLSPHVQINNANSKSACEEFNRIAMKLAAMFGGDKNVCKATQCFRTPGFIHWKESSGEKGFVSKIIYQGLPSSYEEVKKLIATTPAVLEEIHSPHSTDKVSLEAVLTGKVAVEQGERHGTALELATRLYHEYQGKKGSGSLVRTRVEECIRKTFIGADDFLADGGSRREEFEKILVDGKKYFEKNMAEHEEEKRRILNELKEKQIKQAAQGSFTYDLEQGSLKINPYNQTAILERTVQKHGEVICVVGGASYVFNSVSGKWGIENGSICPIAQTLIKDCTLDMVTEESFLVSRCSDRKGEISLDKVSREQEKYLNAGTIKMLGGILLTYSGVSRSTLADFDSNPNLFYCANGVVDMLRGGIGESSESSECRPATVHDKLLCQSPIAFVAGAKCPMWLEFVSQVFSHSRNGETRRDPEMESFLQEVFGYSLSGKMDEEKLFCYVGTGANGKSTTMAALKHITGVHQYATILESSTVTTKGSNYNELFSRIGSRLEGKRVVVIDDCQVVGKWNEGFVKNLTMTDTVSAQMRENERVISNRAKIHIGMNVIPKPEADTISILGRMCFIPFNNSYPRTPAKKMYLEAMIHEEAAGILNWAFEGYRRVCSQSGIVYPAKVVAAVESYKKETFSPLEDALKALYEFPCTDTELGGEWVCVFEIVNEVRAYLEANEKDVFALGKQPNATIGREYSKLCSIPSKQLWFKKKESMLSHVYLIRLTRG